MDNIKELKAKRDTYLKTTRNMITKAEQENRSLDPAEQRDFDNLMRKVDDIAGTIKRADRLEDARLELESKSASGTRSGSIEGETGDFGAFIRAVCDHSPDLNYRQLSASSGAAVLVPAQFREAIMQLQPEEAIVRPRALVIPAGEPADAAISIPALDHSGDNGIYGAMSLQWINEGGEKPETTPSLKEVSLDPKELAGHVVITDKLLRNSAAAGPLLARLFRLAIGGTEDYAFLCGDGVGKPLGVLNSAARIEVNRAGAGAVAFADVAAMMGRVLPDSINRATWVANISVLPKLVQMTDAGGERTVFIAGDASKRIPATLFGIPIRFTGKTPALGTKGDLMLCDFSHYLIKDGSGPFVAASEHVLFTQNKTVIKAFFNVDGTPWLSGPVKLEDGVTTVSPFVVLN